ncbi:Gldg family protein [Sphingorhabdus sp.]|uniref:Gldg family protein n=1 Tax=Sphingorhabdus sp. TaxID=1902408 RepID=UPI004047730E
MTDRFARFGGRTRLFVALLALSLVLLLFAGLAYTRSLDDRPKAALALMTTLPLQWSEGGIEADLAQDAAPHPALARLTQRYDIDPIDDLTTWKPRNGQLLLLAQPRAFAPAELVRLDNWVRSGGRLLILADPALQWGSLYPLGDKRRPLFTSLLSPVFTHWGLELVLPITDDSPRAIRRISAFNIRTVTPGEWLPKGRLSQRCSISSKGLLADCRIGKGRAVLLADADMLDVAFWEGRGMRMLTGGDEFANLAFVEALLMALKSNNALNWDFVGK